RPPPALGPRRHLQLGERPRRHLQGSSRLAVEKERQLEGPLAQLLPGPGHRTHPYLYPLRRSVSFSAAESDTPRQPAVLYPGFQTLAKGERTMRPSLRILSGFCLAALLSSALNAATLSVTDGDESAS